jgi:hypothetical protein
MKCSIFDAGNCGGSFSGSADLNLSPSAPYMMTASKTNAAGYLHKICIQCTNGAQTKNLDNWRIAQCIINIKAQLDVNPKAYKLLKKDAEDIELVDLLIEIFQKLYASLLSEECKILFNTVEVSIDPSESFSRKNNTITFITNSPLIFDGNITYKFALIPFELNMPLNALVCGFEKIIPQSGVSVIEFELNKEDQRK